MEHYVKYRIRQLIQEQKGRKLLIEQFELRLFTMLGVIVVFSTWLGIVTKG